MALQGVPVVFWKDYYNAGLAKPDTPNGLWKLIALRKQTEDASVHLLGSAEKLIVIERRALDKTTGTITIINLESTVWLGIWVQSSFPNAQFVPQAYSGIDPAKPSDKQSNSEGWVDLYAPPLGYAVYEVHLIGKVMGEDIN